MGGCSARRTGAAWLLLIWEAAHEEDWCSVAVVDMRGCSARRTGAAWLLLICEAAQLGGLVQRGCC